MRNDDLVSLAPPSYYRDPSENQDYIHGVLMTPSEFDEKVRAT